ncbi:MAG TPA: pyrroline-5-carboxylate reductase [Actinomycetales bacterium]|nr:pyrroline-5-carboxylate reductase [Actinomycetales bacterium]
MSKPHEKIAVLGGGIMGETILAGILAAGWSGERVILSEQRAEVAQRISQRHGVILADSNPQAVAGADVIVLAVKPQDAGALLGEISSTLEPHALVISVAAGLSTDWFAHRLPTNQPVVRVMPNTPAVVGQGMSAISAGAHATAKHLTLTEELLAQTGRVMRVPEKQQDAVVGLSGSGPAYAFYIADALSEAGVLLGLTREEAQELAIQTLLGAATLLQETGDHPAVARERVSSPGGTTIAALRELDERGVRAALIAAVQASHDRSVELGREMGQ